MKPLGLELTSSEQRKISNIRTHWLYRLGMTAIQGDERFLS